MQDTFKTKRRVLKITYGVVFAGLIIAGIYGAIVYKTTEAITVCSDGPGLLINGSTVTSISLPPDQIPTLSLHTTAPNTGQITKVEFYLNNQTVLGRAVPEGSYAWNMPWVTSLAGLSSGETAQISAKVYYTDTSSGDALSCTTTTPIYATINNTRNSELNFAISPTQWVGPMSASFGITTNVSIDEPGFDPSPYAIYEWGTTIGYVNSNGRNAQFSSGTTTGSGKVKVRIKYGGATKELYVAATVKSPETPLPEPDTTNTSTETPKDPIVNITKNTDSATPQPSRTVQNSTAQECVSNAIGADRYAAINTGTARPSPEEIIKFKICFATSNYVVPSNFAPIAPSAIKKLPVLKTIQVNKLVNEKRVVDNKEKNVLRFGGRAAPNSIVFIYVFSDPLVLTTTTDGDGNWEYVLEDPIEAGNHEVYSVVDRGNGVYERSEVLSFTLDATAEAATINPNGLTLKLASATPAESQRSLGLYIFGSITVLSLAIAGFVITLIRRSRSASAHGTFSAFPAQSPATITTIQEELDQKTQSPENDFDGSEHKE